jgi:hypothetical protein
MGLFCRIFECLVSEGPKSDRLMRYDRSAHAFFSVMWIAATVIY